MQKIRITVSFSGELKRQGAKNIIKHLTQLSGTITLKNAHAKDREEIKADLRKMLEDDLGYNKANYPEKYQDVKITIR